MEDFPDLAIWWNTKVDLTGLVVRTEEGKVVTAKKEMDMTGLYGGHSPDGTIGLWGPGIHQGQTLEEARIEDLAPTILCLLGHPVPENMDGEPLLRAMTPEMACRLVIYQPTGDPGPQAPPRQVYTPDAEKALSQELRDLGYI